MSACSSDGMLVLHAKLIQHLVWLLFKDELMQHLTEKPWQVPRYTLLEALLGSYFGDHHVDHGPSPPRNSLQFASADWKRDPQAVLLAVEQRQAGALRGFS